MTPGTQFLRFTQVGVIGFVVDWACLTFFLWVGTGFFAGRGLSYLCAATATWALNRTWTFFSTDKSLFRQWGMFLSANAAGGMINYGVSAGLAIGLPQVVHAYPVLAIASGSLAGLVINFSLSKRFVFGA